MLKKTLFACIAFLSVSAVHGINNPHPGSIPYPGQMPHTGHMPHAGHPPAAPMPRPSACPPCPCGTAGVAVVGGWLLIPHQGPCDQTLKIQEHHDGAGHAAMAATSHGASHAGAGMGAAAAAHSSATVTGAEGAALHVAGGAVGAPSPLQPLPPPGEEDALEQKLKSQISPPPSYAMGAPTPPALQNVKGGASTVEAPPQQPSAPSAPGRKKYKGKKYSSVKAGDKLGTTARPNTVYTNPTEPIKEKRRQFSLGAPNQAQNGGVPPANASPNQAVGGN